MNASNAELLEEEILRLSETGQVLVRGRKEIARQLLAVRHGGGCFTAAPGPGGQRRRFRLLHADCEGGLLLFAEKSFGAADHADADDGWITFSCGCVSGRALGVVYQARVWWSICRIVGSTGSLPGENRSERFDLLDHEVEER